MSNIRIERVPIQKMGLWLIRADHLMLTFQQDPQAAALARTPSCSHRCQARKARPNS